MLKKSDFLFCAKSNGKILREKEGVSGDRHQLGIGGDKMLRIKQVPCALFVVAVVLLATAGVSTVEGQDDQELDSYLQMSLGDLLNIKTDVASTRSQTVLESFSTVTVIDRSMIENYNFQTVADALETVSGFSVVRTYLKRDLPTGRGVLQDHYANKVLVMINGVPLWHASTGEGCLDRVSIRDVERIEILKGPASVLYGSQAYSGAINIVLRTAAPDTHQISVHAGGGTHSSYASGASYINTARGDLSLFVSGNVRRGAHTEVDFTDETGETSDIDDYVDSTNANILASYGRHSVLLNTYSVDESYLGVVPSYASGAGHEHDVDGWAAAYTLTQTWTDNAESRLQVFYDWNKRNLSRSRDDTIRANIIGWRVGGSLKNNLQVSENLVLVVGSGYDYRSSDEYRNEDTSTGETLAENNMRDRDTYEYSFFGQAELDLSPWQIIAGTRYTENKLFGGNVASRGGLAYKFNENNTVKRMASQAYRAPSLFELYFATPTQTVFGNEDLEPETSDSLELAYQTVWGNFYAQTIFYHVVYDNKIFRKKGSVTLDDGTEVSDVNVYVNGGKFKASGVEMEMKYVQPGSWDVFVNLDYVDGDDGDEVAGSDHYNFKYVPLFSASVGAHKMLGPVSASCVANYMGPMDGSEDEVDESLTLDLNFIFRHKWRGLPITHAISVNNVLDDDVEFPEYVRRKGLNSVPLETGMTAFYSVEAIYEF